MVATRNRALDGHTSLLRRLGFATSLAFSLLAGCAEGLPPDPITTPTTFVPTSTPRPTLVPTATAVPFQPASSLSGARAFLAAGLFPEALASFELVASKASEGELVAEALTGAAVALHEMGFADQAIETLRLAITKAPEGSGTAERAIYVLGVRLAAREDYADSAEVLRALVAAPSGSVLQHYADVQFAASAAAAGNFDDAEGVWTLLLGDTTLPSSLRSRVYADRADAAIEQSDPLGALGWLAQLADLTGDSATRYRLAFLALEAGDSLFFAETLRAIVRDTPSSAYALLAVAELELANEPVDAGLVGLVYYRHRRYPAARSTLEVAVAGRNVSAAHLAFRTYYLAASNEDDGRLEAAVVLYDRAATYDPLSQYTHRAMYWAARVTEDLGRLEEASTRYQQLVRSEPSGPFTTESRFRTGYTQYLAGAFDAAVAQWVTLPGSSDARTEYWQARALEQAGRMTDATAVFEESVRLDPRSFYGIQAARALGTEPVEDVSFVRPVGLTDIDWDLVGEWFRSEQPGDWSDVGATVAGELAAIGLADAARVVLRGIADGSDDPWVVLTVAREADRAGLPDVVITMTYRAFSATSVSRLDLPVEAARPLYPLDYVSLLNASSERYGISPLFLAALIRQESLWNADAVSPANAFGLTQVIEPTGHAIAESLGLELFSPFDLFRPSVSIEFGAFYIGAQVDRFGDPHHALAAYNGGPENASAWAVATGALPADFVATIEFNETKRYVELVIQHYAWYRFLYGDN